MSKRMVKQLTNLNATNQQSRKKLSEKKKCQNLKEKVNGGNAKKRGCNGIEKAQTTDRKDYPTCGKNHKGECQAKGKGGAGGAPKLHNAHKAYIKQIIVKQLKSKEAISSDLDNNDKHEWSKGLDTGTQMYIAQVYMQDNQYNSNDQVTSIGVNKLKDLKKRAKATKRQLMRS